MSHLSQTSMPELAQVAKALADVRRASICMTLIDGRAWTPTELAIHHGWPRSSTTEHLNLLIDAGLIAETRQGKHRYVRLANAEIAETIEALASLAQNRRPAVRSLRGQGLENRLHAARTCYKHLAGQLGVGLTIGLVRVGVIDTTNGYALTPYGSEWFTALGYPIRRRNSTDRRAVVRPCLDWTERVDHLAGIAADTLCEALTDKGWITRSEKDRVVHISENGKAELTRLGLL